MLLWYLMCKVMYKIIYIKGEKMKKMRTKVAAVATVFALALSSMGPVSAKSAEGDRKSVV